MATCPVCEHQQAQGDECELCGKPLARRPVAAAPVPPMAELELHSAAAPGGGPTSKLADLEVTQLPKGPDLPLDRPVGFEGGYEVVGEVEVDRSVELEGGRYVDQEPRTAAPGETVVCRYCRHQQNEGAVCERCGLRLPRGPSARVENQGPAGAAGTVWTRCRRCGAPAKALMRCGDCGHEVPLPDA